MTAVGLAFVAMFGFGSAAVFARVGMQQVGALPVTFLSLLFSFLLSLAIALVIAFSDLTALSLAAVGWCALMGALAFLGGRNLSFLSIGRIGAARSSAIVGTSAVFSAILAIAFTGERPHLLVLLGTLVVIAGLSAALGRSLREGGGAGRGALMGYLLAAVSAACYGSTMVVGKVVTDAGVSPVIISTLSLLCGFMLLAPVAARPAVQTIRRALARRGDFGFIGFAALSGLASATAVNCVYFALQRSEVVVVSPIASANPIITLLLTWLFLSRLENVNRWLFAGTALTVSGVGLVVIGNQL